MRKLRIEYLMGVAQNALWNQPVPIVDNDETVEFAAHWLGNCRFMPGGFQGQVNVQPAPGIEGDYCSFNPRFTVNAGPGGLVSGPAGCVVGRFAWYDGVVDADGTPTQVSTSYANFPFASYPAAPTSVVGFIHRNQQALITTFLSDATLTIPQGFPVVVHSGGDFWVKNRGTTQAQIMAKAFASLADGSCVFGPAGSSPVSATLTGSIGAQTGTFTGSLTGNVLTVTAPGGLSLVAGSLISGTVGGSGVVAGTFITSQLTGTTGGIGTYSVNIPEQNVASGTLNFSYGLLTVASSPAPTGTLAIGDILSTGSVTTGTVITGLGTGAGGAGTYYVSPSQTVAGPTSIAASQVIETKWFAMSSGLPGELVKISSHPLT